MQKDLKPEPRRWSKAARLLAHLGFGVVLALGALWAGTAFSVHFAGPLLWAAWAALGAVAVAAVALRGRRRRLSWAVLAAGAVVVGGWYMTLQPRQDRNWAPDVAHSVSSTQDGDIVTLHNVRNFDWTGPSDATPRWEVRRYDLRKLASVDMFTSVWDNPEIAHLIVSFGFEDGAHVAFSVEIRKEAQESFSVVGGFFRQFELALIAADEADVVRVRTNFRGEDVRLFPVKLNAEQRQSLLLNYLALGNQLQEAPAFYNTVTANCTSTVYGLVRVIKADMPLDLALLYSARLPEYIDSLGGLPGEMPMAERRARAAISARALAMRPGQDFSTLIRGE